MPERTITTNVLKHNLGDLPIIRRSLYKSNLYWKAYEVTRDMLFQGQDLDRESEAIATFLSYPALELAHALDVDYPRWSPKQLPGHNSVMSTDGQTIYIHPAVIDISKKSVQKDKYVYLHDDEKDTTKPILLRTYLASPVAHEMYHIWQFIQYPNTIKGFDSTENERRKQRLEIAAISFTQEYLYARKTQDDEETDSADILIDLINKSS